MRYILLGIFFGILFIIISESMSRSSFSTFTAFCLGLLSAEIVRLRRRLAVIEKDKPHLGPESHSESVTVDQSATDDLTVQEAASGPAPGPDLKSPPKDNTEADLEPHSKTALKSHGEPVPKTVSQYREPSPVESQSAPASETPAAWDQPAAEPVTKKGFIPDSNLPDKIAAYLKSFFTIGNVVLKLGIIIIFFGVSFLLKYAVQRNMFPIEFRLMGVFAAGLLILLTGWRLRNRTDHGYGLALQGGGVGILYLTVFAAFRLYNLLPDTFSMVIMLLLVIFSSCLALLQDAKSLALFGITGGFLCPVLISTGSGSHVMLFSYYALLNSGILAIAWFKAWRELNIVGFAFTFVISAMWGSRYYKPMHFSTTEPFLILFFVFYVLISILFAHGQPVKLKGFIDGPLVFGVPLIFFTLQSTLVKNMEYGLALTALGLGLFYTTLATLLWRRLVEGMRPLTEAFLAMGVVFGSIAIPLALNAQWTSTAWALEGGAMVWVGIRQKRFMARLFGILLQLGAGVSFFLSPLFQFYFSGHIPVDAIHGFHEPHGADAAPIFMNHFYLGALFISISGLFSSFFLCRNPESLNQKIRENRFHLLLLAWGILWWFGSGFHETVRYFNHQNQYHGFLLYCALSFHVMSMGAVRLKWQELKQVQAGFLPIMVILVPLSLFDVVGNEHLFAGSGMFIWITAFVVQYRLLWMFEQEWETANMNMAPLHHLITMWLLMFIISHETVWNLSRLFPPPEYSPLWSGIFQAALPALWIMLLMLRGERLIPWPVGKNAGYYLNHGVAVPALFLVLWLVWRNFDPGNPAPLPYIPLVNPLELSQIFILFVVYYYLFRHPHRESGHGHAAGTLLKPPPLKPPARKNLTDLLPGHSTAWGLAGLIFLWINFVTGRVVHHYSAVSFTWKALHRSVIFQTSISILWSVTALGITVWATKTRRRKVWFCGAVLLGMVVLKLFTVDLAGTRSLSRIISFLAVGALMLIIGYFSPLPPTNGEQRNKHWGKEEP